MRITFEPCNTLQRRARIKRNGQRVDHNASSLAAFMIPAALLDFVQQ